MILDGISVGIHSKKNLQSIFEKWSNLIHLSGVKILNGSDDEFVVEYNNVSGKKVFYSDKRVFLNIPFKKIQTGELLFYSALPFFEIQRQRGSVVTMHAAAVKLSGKGILLLGKTGSGKTTITLSLCLNNKASLIGNDTVNLGIVDKSVVAFSGSKFFTLREESIKRNIPELLNLFPLSRKDPWTHKVNFLPDKLGIDTCYNPVSVIRSYLVHVDETMDKLYIADANTMDVRLYLNENMSRYIRGTAIAIFDNQHRFMGCVPSYDLPSFFKMRVSLIERLIAKTEIIYISGNINDVCQYIVSEK